MKVFQKINQEKYKCPGCGYSILESSYKYINNLRKELIPKCVHCGTSWTEFKKEIV